MCTWQPILSLCTYEWHFAQSQTCLWHPDSIGQIAWKLKWKWKMKTKWNEKWNENDRTHTANMHTLASHPAIVYSSLGLWYASQPWSSCSCTVTLSRHQSAAPQGRRPALSPTWGRSRRRGRHSIAPTYVHGRGSEYFSGSCYQDLSQCDRQWVASSLHLSSSNGMQLTYRLQNLFWEMLSLFIAYTHAAIYCCPVIHTSLCTARCMYVHCRLSTTLPKHAVSSCTSHSWPAGQQRHSCDVPSQTTVYLTASHSSCITQYSP